ncbi:type II toxin-antitoxin system RelE/ParE family toxin [Candidatus Sumerlaeota bacterium]|nr:type II toxin-antitoxin system RelE/ParE family toxin [Candidatus Sumerlaeota bacterium]
MPYTVLLTESAARDLAEIHEYIDLHDSPRKADTILAKIEKAFQSLAGSPERGSHPRELAALGIREYRQVFFKPYRIIYKVSGRNVYVMLIADGRRDMQAFLERRLLEPD